MKLKTIIIENDKENVDDLLWNLNFCGGFEVVDKVTCFEELAQISKNQEYDVAFVSLDLPTSDGFYCSYYLRKHYPEVRIVMMAQDKEYAFEGYENGIFDYILKPLEPERIEKTVNRLREAAIQEEAIIESPQRIMVKLKGGYQMVDVSDVLFLEMRNRKCCMILTDGMEISLQRYTMENLESMFTPFGFYRCYQSVIVQITKVAQLVADTQNRNCYATLKGCDQKLPVSREKFAQMVALLQDSSGITVTGSSKE